MPRTEIKLEFLGMSGINSLVPTVSSPRAVMDTSHFSSHMPLFYPDEKIIKSGIEYELGATVDDVRTDHDCVVKGKVERYGGYGVETPETTLFVEYYRNDYLYIDFISVPCYKSSHNFFGYPLRKTDELNNVSYGDVLSKDTVLGKTDSYGDEGCYNYGLNANVVLMSHPSVSDDGFVISESFAKRAAFPSYKKSVININRNTIPLNVNGTTDIFKFLPNIGDKVRADGMLCAMRERNDWFSVYDLTNRGLSEVDVTFDNPTYVNTHSVVVDIKVTRGNYQKPEFPTKMTEQLDHYAEMLLNYYRNVVKVFDTIMNEKKTMYADGSKLRVSPRLTRFISDCIIKIEAAKSPKIKLSHRRLPIDQYRVEVTTMNVLIPNYGYKLTDIHASKGVVCLILPDNQMPVDELGNVADVISDNNSTISRMNIGRSYEGYLGAMSRDNRHALKNYLTKTYGPDFIRTMPQAGFDYARKYLRDIYEIINSESVQFIDSLNHEEFVAHLDKTVTKELFLFYPPDNENNIVDVIDRFDQTPYKPYLGKVTYTDGMGRRVTTKEDIRMLRMYIMFLEKIGNTYSAVSSSKVNNFGFPVKGTNIDKVRYPHSLTPGKILAETENRILLSYAGAKAAADMMDLALNTNTHKALYRSQLEGLVPFTNRYHINRNDILYGETKSLQVLKHIFAAAGFCIANTNEQ